MKKKDVNYKMVEFARLSRGLNQTELAKLIDIPQSSISRIELGVLGIKEDILAKISTALHYPIDFFSQEVNMYPPNVHYRKRANISQPVLNKVDATMNLYRIFIQKMLNSVEVSTDNIPIIEENKYGTPEVIAQYLRSYWKIPKGPIQNLIELVEHNGILVVLFDFETDLIDGRSMMTDSGHPIIFINKNFPGERARLTLAHELGHIIMHLKTMPILHRDEEEEAFRFGAEFLMPYNEIKSDIPQKLTIQGLADLKRKWKISMQAILYWVEKKECITPNQSRYLWSQINALGIRKKEPIPVPLEKSTLVSEMISLIMTELHYTKSDLAEIFKIYPTELEKYFFNNLPQLRIIKSA